MCFSAMWTYFSPTDDRTNADLINQETPSMQPIPQNDPKSKALQRWLGSSPRFATLFGGPQNPGTSPLKEPWKSSPTSPTLSNQPLPNHAINPTIAYLKDQGPHLDSDKVSVSTGRDYESFHRKRLTATARAQEAKLKDWVNGVGVPTRSLTKRSRFAERLESGGQKTERGFDGGLEG